MNKNYFYILSIIDILKITTIIVAGYQILIKWENYSSYLSKGGSAPYSAIILPTVIFGSIVFTILKLIGNYCLVKSKSNAK